MFYSAGATQLSNPVRTVFVIIGNNYPATIRELSEKRPELRQDKALSDRLEIFTLGGLRIQRNGIPVGGFSVRKVEALLLYLAYTRRSQTREALAELLWNERPQGQALHNLSTVLSELRTQLAPYVVANRQTLMLNSTSDCWLDVLELEDKLVVASKAWTGSNGLGLAAIPQLEQALALYKGDFLAGFSLRDSQGFEDWVSQEREQLRRRVIEALHHLVTAHLDSGAYSAGITQATRLLQLDPLLEEAHRQLMLLLVRVGQRSTALAQYESCRRLLAAELGVEPTPETTSLYEEIRAGRLTNAQLVVHSPPQGTVETRIPQDLRNPYKGLRAFHEVDTLDYFGRQALVEQLRQRFETSEKGIHLLAIIGPSGSGKSSLVKAGLIPALRRQVLDAKSSDGRWFVAEMLPGRQPLEELEVALLRIATNPPTSLLAQLREDERGLLRAVKRILPDDDSHLLLVIDQFEEVFTLTEDESARSLFLDSLCTAVTEPRCPLRIVITLRADFYDRPLHYPTFGDVLHRHSEVVLPMSHTELERAIAGPAERVGVALETGLISTIITDVAEQPGALPLLQYTLTELFDRREGTMLSLAAYRAVGGVTGALACRADDLFNGLDQASQEAAHQLFLRLVTLGEGIEDARRRVRRAELESIATETRTMDTVIEAFSKYRLLTLDRDPSTGEPMVEVAHEALLRAWGRLREWLDESREDLRVHRRLMAASGEWTNSGHDTSFLATGTRLVQFEALARGSNLALNRAETEYLVTSVAERQQQVMTERERHAREKTLERRSLRFLRALVIVLLMATLGALALTGMARYNAVLAERSAAEAHSLALASAAQLALNEGSIDQAISLAKAAQQATNDPPPQAQLVLDEAGYMLGTSHIFQETGKVSSGVLARSAAPLKFAIVSHMGPEFPFAVPIVKGMQDACALLNASCQWLSDPGASIGSDVSVYWKQALTMNPDGIGTTIPQPNLVHSGVQQAADHGIPVIAFNVSVAQDPDPSLPALLYIGSDEFLAGANNARRVFAEARADGKTIQRGVCTLPDAPNVAVFARCAGVKSVFDEEHVPLDLLTIDPNDVDLIARQVADYFKTHPETRAVFMLGPAPASGLDQYIHQASLKPRQLYATTHDTSPEIFQMIRDGYLLQTIDQQPYMQGFQTIISLYLYHQYGLRPSGFINTSSVIDRNNVDFVTQLQKAGYR